MTHHHEHPVVPFTVSETSSVADLVAGMAGTSFQARALAQGVDIWRRMLEDEVTIFLGLAGAMIPAGMRQVMVYLIQNRLIDCLVSTGANLFHDLHETMGHAHLKGQPQADDCMLYHERMNRIYDVYLPEAELAQSERFITDFTQILDPNQAYTTREYLHLLGKELASLGKVEGMLSAAAKAGVPVFCPALGDSVFGTALAAARVKSGGRLMLDVGQDVVEMVQLTTTPEATGVVFVGGGTPKNYIHQAVLCGDLFGRGPRGHNYAIQITMDSPQWGGLSGCTFEECHSWGKEAPDAATAMIYADATIALPVMVTALAQGSARAIASRKRPVLDFAPSPSQPR